MISTPAVAPNTLKADLLRAVEQYGTPLYVYDLRVLYERVQRLRSTLPTSIQIYYSLKANPSLGISSILASLGFGADVASEGELLIAHTAGFSPSRILIGGPAKSPGLLEHLKKDSRFLVSIDSVSELQRLASCGLLCRGILRLRPKSSDGSKRDMANFSRFGIPAEDLTRCLPFLKSSVKVVGFHTYMGSQLLPASAVVQSLWAASDLCHFAAEQLGLRPKELNLGGGFGIPYSRREEELDLEPIAAALASIRNEFAVTHLSIELGRYIVGPCGWYLTKVVEHQNNDGRPAVVVDGGVHQRFDICNLKLTRCQEPVILGAEDTGERLTSDVLGCLCAPGDILASACEVPPLAKGSVLAFPNSGAYGLTASPSAFLCHPAPPEVALHNGTFWIFRERGSVESAICGQKRI